MRMKNTLGVPVGIGIVSAALILLVSEAQFVIPLGNNYSVGIGEIFNTLAAALGGPITVIITQLLTASGHFMLNPDLYTETSFLFIALADAVIHIGAMLIITFSYARFLFPRENKTSAFISGWWLTIGVYYYLILLPLQVVLLDYADPGYGAAYPAFARIFLPEFIGTAAITTLIWFALPKRFRKPLWIQERTVLSPAEGQPRNGFRT